MNNSMNAAQVNSHHFHTLTAPVKSVHMPKTFSKQFGCEKV